MATKKKMIKVKCKAEWGLCRAEQAGAPAGTLRHICGADVEMEPADTRNPVKRAACCKKHTCHWCGRNPV